MAANLLNLPSYRDKGRFFMGSERRYPFLLGVAEKIRLFFYASNQEGGKTEWPMKKQIRHQCNLPGRGP